jgi:hypothetical protein
VGDELRVCHGRKPARHVEEDQVNTCEISQLIEVSTFVGEEAKQ